MTRKLGVRLGGLALVLACAACSTPARYQSSEGDGPQAPESLAPTRPTGLESSEATAPEPEPEHSTVPPPPPREEQPSHAELEAQKQANNPLANMKTFNLQNYYFPNLSGTDQSANQFWFRYAQPIKIDGGSWLMRASLPLSTVPTGNENYESGIGDANVFASYLFDTDNPDKSMGIGPLLGLPTATDDALGPSQWSLGAAAVYFDMSSKLFQYGGLVTYQHKIAGSSSDPDVNLLALQPFGILQLGSGVYLRSTGIWAFDLETGNYSVPVGFGLGKVVKAGKTVFNFYLEPQMSVLSEGPGQPLFQVLFGFNTQFLGG